MAIDKLSNYGRLGDCGSLVGWLKFSNHVNCFKGKLDSSP